MFECVDGGPDVFAAEFLVNKEWFIENIDVSSFIDPPNKMYFTFCDWEFSVWIEGEAHRELADCVAVEFLFAKMVFLICLIMVVLVSEVFRFPLDVIKVGKLLGRPKEVIEATVETLYVRVSPRLIERDENYLHAEVQAEPCKFAKGARMNETTAKSSFVIKFKEGRLWISFPVFRAKCDDIVGSLRGILIKVGMTGIDVNPVNRYDAAVAGNIAWCY